ncbi:conserved protein of unknown function [Pseudomonas marincola]|uniref:Uncharacterized protein n=1 Tax=Pseudomonas marincola TaxID=437900 RepID=A0A653E1P6_9PSED|nr:conserved protein of unknown function [Pseudomonas marincola]
MDSGAKQRNPSSNLRNTIIPESIRKNAMTPPGHAPDNHKPPEDG